LNGCGFSSKKYGNTLQPQTSVPVVQQTYSTPTIRQESHSEAQLQKTLKQYGGAMEERRHIIQMCKDLEKQNKCFFTPSNTIDLLKLIHQNYQEYREGNVLVDSVSLMFCQDSRILNIPSKVYLFFMDEKLARELDCSTNKWGEFFSIANLINTRR
jgi:hypothetical protein